ncbi:hypothetical protein PAXINDRAFT_22046 [Paxillus involutus ATCC 200175]|uniref:Uncharacterized protein n=1 Tax=Paxillus involutus ATCC 200175 TaxID=664439 RepID=A0A0C9T8W9_PAXIN|nr:hypothetical protein PAXINDRAFT_22046 [Paxillus involutus ATCC 200175]
MPLLPVIPSTNPAIESTESVNHECGKKDNSTPALQSYEIVPYIFAWDTRPPPDEIERGPCFHCWSYICFGQRDPNINPDENVAQPPAQLDPSGHDLARTNLRSLGPLDRLSVWLHLRKPPPPPPTAASPSTNIQSTSSPHTDLYASTPLANQPPPSNAITSRVDTTEVLVHPSTISSRTLSPPAPAPAPADLNTDADDARSEAESNPWLPTNAGRVDPTSASASTGYMGQLHPDNPWSDD